MRVMPTLRSHRRTTPEGPSGPQIARPRVRSANPFKLARESAQRTVEHAKSLVRLEAELAATELKKKVAAVGIGIGLVAGAAVLAVFGVAVLFATLAAVLATFLATWLALLVVTAFLFVLAVVLALLGRSAFRKATPVAPEQAIKEAKLTREALKQ